MYKYSKNQLGSATVTAIVVMVFITTIITGLLPMITSNIRLGSANQDALQAQYAAEAGVKRGLISLMAPNYTDWNWLGIEQNLTDEDPIKYIVSITPNLNNGQAPHQGIEYTITSTAKVGDALRTATQKYTVTNGGISPIDPNSALAYSLYSAGNIVVGHNNFVYNGDTGSGGNTVGDITLDKGYSNKQYLIGVTFPYINYYDYSKAPYPKASGTLTQDKYFVDGNWILPKKADFDAHKTVIYATGNMVFEKNINMEGNFLLVAKGNIVFNNNAYLKNAVIIASGNVVFKNNATVYGTVIAGGNIVFNNNAQIYYDPDVIKMFMPPL